MLFWYKTRFTVKHKSAHCRLALKSLEIQVQSVIARIESIPKASSRKNSPDNLGRNINTTA